MDIRNERQKLLSYTEIARKYNIDPQTATKYAESEMRPVYSLCCLILTFNRSIDKLAKMR